MPNVLSSFQIVANAQGEHSLPKLDYAYDALEQSIDAQTVELHYSKHHQTYVTNLNAALQKHPELAKKSVEELLLDLNSVPEDIRGIVRNHGGGHSYHAIYWATLCAPSKSGAPSADLLKAIESSFNNLDSFKDQLTKTSVGTFGSGWGWLSLNAQGQLIIESTPNQDSPYSKGNIPLFGVDVWEHAYYLKYQNRRPEYVAKIFEIVNWENVSARYNEAINSLKG